MYVHTYFSYAEFYLFITYRETSKKSILSVFINQMYMLNKITFNLQMAFFRHEFYTLSTI